MLRYSLLSLMDVVLVFGLLFAALFYTGLVNLVSGLILLILYGFWVLFRYGTFPFHQPKVGIEAMKGNLCVDTPLTLQGRVKYKGEPWSAENIGEHIEERPEVTIVKTDGLNILVHSFKHG